MRPATSLSYAAKPPAGRDFLDQAEHALEVSLKRLIEEKDFDAFVLRMKTELGVILQAQTVAIKDELVEELLEQLK